MTEPAELILVDTFDLKPSQPFDFRHTLWKPSHFNTGLEKHTLKRTWRTFRLGERLCGTVLLMRSRGRLEVQVYSTSEWVPADTDKLRHRIVHAYGLNEDLSEFLRIASQVSSFRTPLHALNGMRQSCPENLFEIAIVSLLLQNATIARTTQMMVNLLTHYGREVVFDGVTLRAFFTPSEILNVPETTFREKDRLGYRAKYIGRFAEFFIKYDPDTVATVDKQVLISQFQSIKGVGPYTAAIIASHAVRDHSALGLDVWNRKILAEHILGVADAEPGVVASKMQRLFPGYEGLAGLYFIENEYRLRPVVPLVAEY